MKNSEFPPWFLSTYLLAVTAFVFAYLAYASFGIGDDPSDFAQRIIDSTSGFLLGTVLGPIIGYLIGTSLGSKTKENVIDRLVHKVVDKGPAGPDGPEGPKGPNDL